MQNYFFIIIKPGIFASAICIWLVHLFIKFVCLSGKAGIAF